MKLAWQTILLHQLPARGRLEIYFIADILAALERRRYSGYLHLVRGRQRKVIAFERGAVVAVRSNRPHELLGEMLVRGRFLDPLIQRQLGAAYRAQPRAVPYGRYLVEKGAVAAQQLAQRLRQIHRYRLLECLGWHEGEFFICAAEKVPREIPGPALEIAALWRWLQTLTFPAAQALRAPRPYEEGKLADHFFIDLVHTFRRSRDSGTLFLIGRSGQEKRFRFFHGRLAGAVSNRESERLGQILIRLGLLQGEELRLALAVKGGRLLGDYLVQEGKISHNGLESGLQRQLWLRFLEALTWTAADYRFERLYAVPCLHCHRQFWLRQQPVAHLCRACREEVIGRLPKPGLTTATVDPASSPCKQAEKRSPAAPFKEGAAHAQKKSTAEGAPSGQVLPQRKRSSVHPCLDCRQLIFSPSKICPACWIQRRQEKDKNFRSLVRKVKGRSK